MARAEWVPRTHLGLVWDRVCGKRLLGRVVFYSLRGARRATFWRAIRAPFRQPDDIKSCFTLREAINWVEIEPKNGE